MRDRLLPLSLNELPGSLQQFFKFAVGQSTFGRMRLTCGCHKTVPPLSPSPLGSEKSEQRAMDGEASESPDRLKRRKALTY